MLVSTNATCPNPALLGPKLAPIEMTLIQEPTICSFSLKRCVPSLSSLATASIIGFGLGIVMAMAHHAWTSYLANKISNIPFPPGSKGEDLRDLCHDIILDMGPVESIRASFAQKAYTVLTAPGLKDIWNMDLSKYREIISMLPPYDDEAAWTPEIIKKALDAVKRSV